MAGINNNLYPPLVSTWMPAFIRTSSCKVYFSFSSFNDPTEVANVQIMISNQNSSLSALDSSKYLADIKIASWDMDIDEEGNTLYYVTIDPSDLQDGEFEIDQYYKVQLRFTSTEADPWNGSQSQIAKWLTDNEAFFSEWSTVCLIKGIEQPSIYLKGFESTDIQYFTTDVVDIVGGLYYTQNSDLEDEYLKSYNIKIYHYIAEDDIQLVFDSGIVYTNNFYPNEINYTMSVQLESAELYYLDFSYTTNNEYSETLDPRPFAIVAAEGEVLDATITATPDVENGRMVIHVLGNGSGTFLGNLCIRRASAESSFLRWEDVNITTEYDQALLDYTWYDYTIKSGVYYKYCVQKIDTKGVRGLVVTTRYPVMIYLEDMFLTKGDMQLRIKYDPTMSSFKTNYSDVKTDTLGSKYPYIRRNGNVAYKTFPIAGLITSFCDEDNLFSSREEFYGDVQDYYDRFNADEQITPYRDFIYEREFRQKIMDFLEKDDIKLFRSLPEGNILVRLMDVSYTPNQTLGRMVYSFSATAYEMDECSIENYKKYGILSVGNYSNYIEYDYSKTGQLSGIFSANTNVLLELQNKYTLEEGDDYTNDVKYLTWLRLEFQGDPYLIECGTDGSLTIVSGSHEKTENTVNGYIVYINGEAILVSPRGYYELDDDDTIVTSIQFPVDTDVLIDYTAYIEESEKASNTVIANEYSSFKRAGQLWGTFSLDEPISKEIYMKYYENASTYYQHLVSIDRLVIEAEPGVVVYVKDSFDDGYNEHEVGSTGVLKFYDDEATISECFFSGIHLNEIEDPERVDVGDWEFRDTGITVETIDDIPRPRKNCVYTILDSSGIASPLSNIMEINTDSGVINENYKEYIQLLQDEVNNSGQKYIYYHNDWYYFTSNNIVLCPIVGLIDYTVEVIKGVY